MRAQHVAGVDEAGRGALAGPVAVAAVILPSDEVIDGLADSKRLTARRRERLAARIRASAVAWAVVFVDSGQIDAINILNATLCGMQQAVSALAPAASSALIDGNQCPPLSIPAQAVIGGDASEPAISAASILAKVARDAEMVLLDQAFPGYGFAQHMGYGTAAHNLALTRLGACPSHRHSFAPVRAAGRRPRPLQVNLDLG